MAVFDESESPPGIEGKKEAVLMAGRTRMLLAVVTVVILTCAAREARAACSDCATTCASGCIADGGCSSYSSTDCSGGVATCYYQCRDGAHGWADCGCGGGSPIFKKRPVNPAPTKGFSKQPAKPVQAATAAQPVKPVQPVITARAAKPVSSAKPERQAKPEKPASPCSAQGD